MFLCSQGTGVLFKRSRSITHDDRRKNAQRFDEQFYQGIALDGESRDVPMPSFAPAEAMQQYQPESELERTTNSDDKEVLLKLLENPEIAEMIKGLAENL